MLSNHTETDFAEYHYYRLNQLLLSILMLWPFQRSKYANIKHAFQLGIMLSLILCQLTSFLTSQLTMNCSIVMFSYIAPIVACIIQYYSFCIKRNKLTRIWKDIRECWCILENEVERNIMRQYSSTGELYTKLLLGESLYRCNSLVSITMGIFIYAFILFSPIILDVTFPLNETRPHPFYISTEYFVDEETYYFPIICHWLIGLCITSFTVVAIDTFVLVYIEHICGLLRIASYRIEHAMDVYALPNSAQKEECTVLHNIGTAVDVHRKALECCQFLISNFGSTFFLIIVVCVISLSLNLYRTLRAISSFNDINELFSSVMLVNLHFVFMFLGSYYGQKITDDNNKIFNNTYNTRWYLAPIKVQKLLLFIMMNTTKTYALNIILIIASLEDFAKLSSTSISYFTVIYSLLY